MVNNEIRWYTDDHFHFLSLVLTVHHHHHLILLLHRIMTILGIHLALPWTCHISIQQIRVDRLFIPTLSRLKVKTLPLPLMTRTLMALPCIMDCPIYRIILILTLMSDHL